MTARVHIFDPAFGGSDGHYLTYNGAIVAELERRGLGAVVYAAATWKATMAPDFPVRPLFTTDLFDEPLAEEETWPLEYFSMLGEATYGDLSTLPAEDFHAGDIAYFVTITHNQIDGVRRWIEGLPPARRPRVALRLSYLAHRMPHLQGRRNTGLTALLLRYAVRRLLEAHPRTTIFTDTDEMLADLEAIVEAPASLLPLPLPVHDAPPATEPAGRLTCAYLGHASDKKGVLLLPQIVEAFRGRPSAPRFVIQMLDNENRFAESAEALERSPDLVTLLRGPLSRADYIGRLQDADIVLLPYGLSYYGWASSGIFSEAMLLGKVIVAPRESWMGREAARFDAGCVTFDDWSARGVAQALGQAIADFPGLRRRAEKAATKWTAVHGPGPYVQALLATAPLVAELK